MLTGRAVRFGTDLFLSVSVGPSFGAVTESSTTQWSEEHHGGAQTYHVIDEPVPGLNKYRVGLKGGAGLDVRLGDAIWSHARVHYDLGLSDVTTHENWQVSSLLFQLDLLLAL